MSSSRRLGSTTTPLIVVQWIIAVSTVVGGLYVVSPLLRVSINLYGKSAWLQTVSSDIGILAFGCIFILSGLLMIFGIVTRKVKWRSAGLFLNGLCRFYVIVASILAVGILPVTWLANATIMVIVFYIWGRIRKRGVE